MHVSTKKWLFLKISSFILIPFMIWFVLNLVSIYDQEQDFLIKFFNNPKINLLFLIFIINSFFFFSLNISEVFEDYINNEKIKNVANKCLFLFAIIMSMFTITILLI